MAPRKDKGTVIGFLIRRIGQAIIVLFLVTFTLGLIVYPGLYAIYLSLLNKTQTRFVGLANYRFLFGRETFWMVVEQSAIFAGTAVLFKALIGIVTAHLVNNLPGKGQRKWRGMLLVPWVIPLALYLLTFIFAFASRPPLK